MRPPRLPQLGLLSKVILGLAAVGLVPLGLAAYRLIDLNREALREQVLRTNTVAAATAAARVAEVVAARRDLAAATAGQVAAGPAAASGIVQALLAARPDLAAAVVVNSAGEEVVRAQRKDLATEVERVLAAPGGEPLVAVAGAGDDHGWLRVEAPLTGGGALQLVADGRPLAAAVESALVGEHARLTLFGAGGEVIAGSPAAVDELPVDLVDNARSGKLSGAGLYPTPGGDRVLAAFDAVPGTPWFVVSRQPARVAEGVAVRMLRDAGAAVGLALLLTIALAATAYVSVVRPIRRLTRVQRRLAGLSGKPSRGDEIEQLRASFDRLERRVRDKEAIEQVFLGRYQVFDVLGQGAMGIVFRGWDPKLRRGVALKTVRFDREVTGEAEGELASRLLHEAVTAARFNHPNIVAVYDVEDAAESAFIAMELVEGESLERHLWLRHHLPPGATALLGAAVARALATAHSREVVHQDIKPGNVLLGVDGTIKVTDFGISRFLTALTESREAIFGTPGYVPPEALQGAGYDRRGDLFSLGAVLYQCLTGERPFGGHSLKEIIQRTLKAEVAPPSHLNPDVPPELDALIVELLARDPDRRPRDAAAVADRLERIAHDHGASWEAGAFRIAKGPAADQEDIDEPPESLFIPTRRVDAPATRPAGGGIDA